MLCWAMVGMLMYRNFAFKAVSSLIEYVLASEEEWVQVFGFLAYRPNLRIFIIVYQLFVFVRACGPLRAMVSSFMRFLDHTHNGAPQSVGFFWTSSQLVAQTCT